MFLEKKTRKRRGVKISQRDSQIREKETHDQMEKGASLGISLLEKRSKFIALSAAMSCEEDEWRSKKTIDGKHYGAHSKGVAGHGGTM